MIGTLAQLNDEARDLAAHGWIVRLVSPPPTEHPDAARLEVHASCVRDTTFVLHLVDDQVTVQCQCQQELSLLGSCGIGTHKAERLLRSYASPPPARAGLEAGMTPLQVRSPASAMADLVLDEICRATWPDGSALIEIHPEVLRQRLWPRILELIESSTINQDLS